MKKYPQLFILFAAAVFPLIISCSLDPDRKLNDAIENYGAGKPGAEEALANEFIKNVSIDFITETNLQSNGTILYNLDNNEVELVYPLEQTVSLAGGQGIRQIDMNEKYIILHDGLKFGVFDRDGDFLHEEAVGDKTTPLRSLVISGDDIIYYKNSILYRYNILTRTNDTLLNDTFPPPYTSYYTAQLYRINDFLCLLSGIAGSYYFNIVNLSGASVVLKNLKMSSSKHHMGPDDILYITGNSGNWELMRYQLDSKSKKSIKKFSDIRDIELTSQGCVWESSTGLWFSGYGKESVRVPFSYLLAGNYKGRVLLQFGERYYFIDMKRMSAALAVLREKTPDLFKEK